MSIVNHIDKNTPTATLKDSLLTAGNNILYGFSAAGKKALVTTAYTTGTNRIRNWGKLTQNRLVKPSAMVLRHMDMANFDIYTFTMNAGCEDNFLFGDYLIIKDDMTLFEFDPTENENVMSDMLATHFHDMILQDIQMAYAYLSFMQVYIQMVIDVQDDETEPERTEITITPYEL